MTAPAQDVTSLEREFAGCAMAQAHPLVREWRGAKLETDLLEAVRASVQTIADEAEAQRVADVMHGLALPAASYKGRLIDVGGIRCIAHIDFPDPSGGFPFVKIRCASAPPGSIADWGPISEGIARAFEEFRPRALHFFHASHLPLQAPAARTDTHLIAAPARIVAERADAPGLGRIELRRPTSLDFYPRYEAAYEQMLDVRPFLRGEIGAEARETLAQCLEQALLCEVFVDGAWSGLIAARRDRLAGVRGLQVVEIVLTQSARGYRLGPAVHQRFARSVAEADAAAILMGTISPKNAPSLRTALRAGRVEIGRFLLVDL